MDLVAAINRVIVPGGDVNRLRWAGERGHYEVYYLTLNDLPSQLGLWLRYTLDAPLQGEGVCEVWGHVFDRATPARSFGLKERFPLSRLEKPAEGLVRIGESALLPASARGSLGAGASSLSWELAFEPSARAIHMAPYPLRALGLASTNMLIALPDGRFRGQVRAFGQTLQLADAPGTLAHLWGRKHAERWVWGHCNAFEGRDDCSLDAVAVWLHRLGKVRGPLTSCFVRYRGCDYCLNALPALASNRSQARFPEWRFEGRAGGLTFKGAFRASPDAMLQVSYEDPDGEPCHCANSEVADLSLEVFRGRVRMDALASEGTAHLEFGDRSARPDVRRSV